MRSHQKRGCFKSEGTAEGGRPLPKTHNTQHNDATKSGNVDTSQILSGTFVRNLYDVFRDLHMYTLGYAFVHSYHARGFG